jgi:hypothetical protein
MIPRRKTGQNSEQEVPRRISQQRGPEAIPPPPPLKSKTFAGLEANALQAVNFSRETSTEAATTLMYTPLVVPASLVL